MTNAAKVAGAAAYALKNKKTRAQIEKGLNKLKKQGEKEIAKITKNIDSVIDESEKKLDKKITKKLKG